MDDHEAAAAEIAGARVGHRHGEADRDRGIHRIAASLQNVDTDARRQWLLRHHHAVTANGGLRLADLGVRPLLTRRHERQRDKADKREAGADRC